MNAALYAEPTTRAPGQKGRARKKGDRLPNPTQLARSRGFRWRDERVTIYGKRVKVRVKSLRGLWYSSAHTRPLRIVVVRDPSGKRRDDCFFTTAVSFDDMIATLRQASWTEVNFADPAQRVGSVELTGERLLHMHTSLSRGA